MFSVGWAIHHHVYYIYYNMHNIGTIIIYTYTHIPANNLIHAHLKCYLAHILTRRAKTTYVRGAAIWVQIFKKKNVFLNPSKLPTRAPYLFDRTALRSRWNKQLQQECRVPLPINKCIYLRFIPQNWNRRVCSSKRCR